SWPLSIRSPARRFDLRRRCRLLLQRHSHTLEAVGDPRRDARPEASRRSGLTRPHGVATMRQISMETEYGPKVYAPLNRSCEAGKEDCSSGLLRARFV